MLERVDDGEVALDGDGHRHEDGAHAADVTKPEADRHDVDVDLAGVVGRDRGQAEDEDGDEQVQEVERGQACARRRERFFFKIYILILTKWELVPFETEK